MDRDREIRWLVDRARIVDTVVGFANALDAKDWARLRAFLAGEVEVDYSDFRGEPPSRISADVFVAARRQGLGGLRTLHISTNHAVEIAADQARCTSAYRIYRIDPGAEPGHDRLDTAGHYEHELERSPDGWRISRIRQTVVLREGNPSIHGAFRPNGPSRDP